jgi:cytochrome c-type biogenesis protein
VEARGRLHQRRALNVLDLAVALFAGVATVASPCILPILPILLGASVGRGDRGRPLCIVLGFVAMFSAMALLFGASTRVLGISPGAVRNGAIGALLIFGVLSIFPQLFDRLAERMAPIADVAARVGQATGPGRLGGLVLGATLGALWTPCAGPVLASIFALISSAESPWRGAPLLVAYALGSGLPMLAIAYGGQAFSSRMRSMGERAVAIRRGFGVAVVVVAVAMIGGYDVLATAWISRP